MRVIEGLVYSQVLSHRDSMNTIQYLASKHGIKMGMAFRLRRVWINILKRLGITL